MRKETKISDVIIIIPRVFRDDRGEFFESFSINKLKEYGIEFTPAQENCDLSEEKGTIRGLHFQNNPMAKAKLVCCTKGRVMDFAVDLRKNSPMYLKYVKAELSDENKSVIYTADLRMELYSFNNAEDYLKGHYGEKFMEMPPIEQRLIGINHVEIFRNEKII